MMWLMSKRGWIAVVGVILVTLALGYALPGQAQLGVLPREECTRLGLQCQEGLRATIIRIINILLSIVAVIAVIMIIYGGVRYIVSAGDEEAAKTAKRVILYAMIGLIVIGLSAAIVNFTIRATRGEQEELAPDAVREEF